MPALRTDRRRSGVASARLRAAAAAVALWVPLAVPAGTAQAHPLGPAEARGRMLYLTGVSTDGTPVSGRFSETRLELTGAALACAGCHGPDGRGRPESGVIPGDVTWTALTKTYGHAHAHGLRHGPFDEVSLRRFLRTGVYPGGGSGDPAMPVLEVDGRDLDDLIAYLKRLGNLPEPGVDDGTVTVGTLVPASGPSAAAGAAVVAALRACFDALSASGGLYGRRVELAVHRVDAGSATAAVEVGRWLAERQPFALVATLTPGLDGALSPTLAAAGIPVIGPVGADGGGEGLDSSIYRLVAGLEEQTLALVRFAAARFGGPGQTVAILHAGDADLDRIAETARDAIAGASPTAVRVIAAAGAAAEPAWGDAPQAAVLLGPAQRFGALLKAAGDDGRLPVLVPAAMVRTDPGALPADLAGRVYVAYPTAPADRKGWALEELAELLGDDDGAGSAHGYAVIAAVSAAKVLVEAIRRSGRELTRHRLVETLNAFYRFDTGLTPPVTFSRNRRVGARGAHVLKLVGGNAVPQQLGWVEAD